jgi:hypothetical protein
MLRRKPLGLPNTLLPLCGKRIPEQIKAGSFPLHLKPEDWTSGDINWLLDVIAPNTKATTAVLPKFSKVFKNGNPRLHPLARQTPVNFMQLCGLQA